MRVYSGGKQDWVGARLPTEGSHPGDIAAPVSRATTLSAEHIGELFDGTVVDMNREEATVRLDRPIVAGTLVRGVRGLHLGDHIRMRLLAIGQPPEFTRVSRHTR